MHTLSFEGETPAALVDAVAAQKYSEIWLDTPPLSVNFVPDIGGDGDLSHLDSLVDGAVVIPVTIDKRRREEHKCVSHAAACKAIPETIEYSNHPITVAFALTDFKLEGKTLKKLIMSVASKPFPPHVDMEGFYVFMSRVRMSKDIRLLCKPPEGLDNLLALRHAPELKIWDGGSEKTGDWSEVKARQVASTIVPAPPAAPRKKKPPTSGPIRAQPKSTLSQASRWRPRPPGPSPPSPKKPRREPQPQADEPPPKPPSAKALGKRKRDEPPVVRTPEPRVVRTPRLDDSDSDD